jgi:hypothetical protein
MRITPILLIFLFVTSIGFGQSVFINEIHYENKNADENEGFEIAGTAGVNLANYIVVLYSGDGTVLSTIQLTGLIPNEQGGFGAIWFPQTPMPDGPNGIALIKNSPPTVVDFLSYEGEITAVAGEASGLTSNNIGVSEDAQSNKNKSLQRDAAGGWTGPFNNSPGQINKSQGTLTVTKNEIESFVMYPNPVINGQIYLTTPNTGIEKQIEIYSLNGQLLVNRNSYQSKEAINVANLTKGIYMVRVIEEGKIVTRKLIIN